MGRKDRVISADGHVETPPVSASRFLEGIKDREGSFPHSQIT